MENKDKELQEMQMLEQNLQSLFFQKQSFQMELSETLSAIKEIENAGDQVFKIVGQIMIKKDKAKIKQELEEKKKMLELRLKSLEKQEESFASEAKKIRDKVVK